MEILITRSIESLILPPGGVVLLLVIGLLLIRHHWHSAATVIGLALLALYTLSLPVTADKLLRSLEAYPALQPQDTKGSPAQAIVVLGAGRYPGAPEYGGDTVSAGGLERLRYAAHLHRLTNLPLVVSGGSPLGEALPEAALMQQSLANDFHITDVWVEAQGRTTAENAFFTQALLDEKGIHHVYLVTHAWHMPRAADIFRQAGLAITPAPAMFATTRSHGALLHWLPSAIALQASSLALREKLGLLWYRMRHRASTAASSTAR
ncbi:MAG: YdcF family protein [Gammaproteobacteria bacterium]|nr:YdcF family protein [Gammaproteobacteria bacterium]